MNKTGSLSAYARHRKTAHLVGGSLQAVQKAMNAGRINVSKVAGGYVVDFEAADAQWTANTHPSQGKDASDRPARHSSAAPRAPAVDQVDADASSNRTASQFNVGRAAKMGYEAGQAELNYRARLGQLVERSKEESRARTLAQEVKDAILGVPDRISALLAGESDPLRVHIMLTDELIIALERLSNTEAA